MAWPEFHFWNFTQISRLKSEISRYFHRNFIEISIFNEISRAISLKFQGNFNEIANFMKFQCEITMKFQCEKWNYNEISDFIEISSNFLENSLKLRMSFSMKFRWNYFFSYEKCLQLYVFMVDLIFLFFWIFDKIQWNFFEISLKKINEIS